MNTYTVYDFTDIRILMDDKKYDEALTILNQMNDYSSATLGIKSPYVMYFIAICQANLGQTYSAVKWLRMAKTIDPFNNDVACFYTTLLCEIETSIDSLVPYGKAKWAEVEKIYLFLREHGHVRSSLQFNMIRFYIKINELKTARLMLTNFLERNPNDDEANFMLTSLDAFGVSTEKLNRRSKLKAA